jgi:fermentation-respiration switch protein FrsA (DUF1100 family)
MASGLCLMDAPRANPEFDTEAVPQRPRPGRARVRRWALRFLRTGVLIYLGLTAVLFALQTKIIFPGAETQGQPEAVVRAGPDEELVTLTTAGGDRVVALFGPALTADGRPDPRATSRPTLLYFYGNGMCLRDAADELERFRRLGLNVLIPEYVGYGMSGGKPGESGCYATADAAYDHLRARRDVDPRFIVVGGWSLGGAVAIDLASRKPVIGLVAFSSFTSMVEMARRNFPFLPASLLLRHRFDNQRNIARVACPILIGHGRLDTLIPYEMSERLTAAAKSPVTRLTIDGAGHNDFYAVGGDQVFDAVRQFVGQLPPAR